MNRIATFYAALIAIVLLPIAAQAQFPRTVLIEEFNSATCVPCVGATPILNEAIANGQGRVVSVRYHMNFPSKNDPWYLANPTENDTRKTLYSVSGIPAARFDGTISSVAPTEKAAVTQVISSELEVEATAKMEVTQSRSESNVTVTVTITAPPADPVSNLKLFAAAVEGHIHVDTLILSGWNHEKDIHDVFRKMISGISGMDVIVAAGKSKSFTLNYTIGNDWQPEEMFVVAWLQDDFDHSVAQAGASAKLTAGVNAPSSPVAGLSLQESFPNPVNDIATIRYAVDQSSAVTIELRDMTGALLYERNEGRIETGEHIVRLDVSSLPAGAYLYTVRAGALRQSRTLMVVR